MRKPYNNNWLLFSAIIETALYVMGEDCDFKRIDYAVKQHMQWYKGDGWLTIGFCGNQPSIGESYISAGSLYLCSTVFLPLGLDGDDPSGAEKREPGPLRRYGAVRIRNGIRRSGCSSFS